MMLSSERSAEAMTKAVRRFLYRNVGDGGNFQEATEAPEAPVPRPEAKAGGDREERERRAFAAGVMEGKAQAQATADKRIQESRRAVARAIGGLRKQRESYFRELESEVVALAMAIAKRILHREAQIDPLVLAGVVRVALERVAGVARVTLHVHPSEADRWRDLFAHDLQWPGTLEIAADEQVAPGSCTLSSELGSTHLSLEGQLKPVEDGFLDLLNRKPE